MTDPTRPSGFARLPGYLANHAARVFNRRMETRLKPHGLSMTLLVPLLMLRRLGPTMQRDLVRSSPVAQPAIVAALAKAAALGLIEQTPSDVDRRAVRIAATGKGLTAAAKGQEELRQANAQGLRGFSAAEADMLADLLERLIANLEA